MARLSQARVDVLARLAEHGTQLEHEITSRLVSLALTEAGYIEREPGTSSNPTRLTITDLGRSQLKQSDSCPCRTCRQGLWTKG